MRRRSRTRRVLKWVGTVACALVILGFLASLRWIVTLRLASLLVGLGSGCIELQWLGDTASRSWHLAVHEWPWPVELCWSPALVQVLASDFMPRVVGVRLPLWLLLVAAAIPTVQLWHVDRRAAPPGHCPKCGYNLTGNVSGICPECGTPIKREGKPA